MSQKNNRTKIRKTSPLLAATAGIALLALSACGSSGSDTAAAAASGQPTASASADPSSGTGSTDGSFPGRMPGTSGTIAAKQGTTLQVQNQTDGQVAVTYTAKTAITAQVAAGLKNVTVGSCVSVTPASTASSSSSAQTVVAAGTVRISQPVDGACTGGFGGGQGGFPGGSASGFPSDRPTAMPSDLAGGGSGSRPTGAPSGMGGGGMGANGSVTAVNGNSFTVKSSFPAASGDATTSTTATTVTVTVTGSTTYTTTRSSDASALKVGQCVVATGTSDGTGTVAAERLVVSAPVDGECSSGLGGFNRPGGAA